MKNKGITLIALVVTIIVLLILAGITITMVVGENGIVELAKRAAQKTENTEGNEIKDLNNLSDYTHELLDEGNTSIKQVTDETPGELVGIGTETNPYLIESIEDLVAFSNEVAEGNTFEEKVVRLSVSLDFQSDLSYRNPQTTEFNDVNGDTKTEPLKTELTTGGGFNPIGPDATHPFKGTFNGGKHAIKNILVSRTDGKPVGLFGYAGENSSINNIIMTDVNITTTESYAGGLVGRNDNGIIENVKTEGGTVKAKEYAGGIVGQNDNGGSIILCSNSANISENGVADNTNHVGVQIGGIVGNSRNNSIVKECLNIGKITALNGSVGGIVGNSNVGGTVEKCQNKGEVTSTGKAAQNIAGIVGWCGAGTIKECENTGKITGTSYDVGGIVGDIKNEGATVISCTNEGIIEGKQHVGGIAGIVGENTTSKIEIVSSTNNGAVTGDKLIGGIAGTSWNTIVNNCNNSADIVEKGAANNEESVYNYIGGVVGYSRNNSIVKECVNTGKIIGLNSHVGGIAGVSDISGIEKCQNKGEVTSTGKVAQNIAGIVGWTNGTIKECENTGNVTGAYSDVGGIVGDIKNEGATVISCTNKGIIEGKQRVGGIAGVVGENTTSKIEIISSTNNGAVTGNQYIGGIAGYSYNTVIDSCSNNGIITGNGILATSEGQYYAVVGGIVGMAHVSSEIKNSQNHNEVKNTKGKHVGGIVGQLSNTSLIYNCYNEGKIGVLEKSIDAYDVGGICGALVDKSTVSKCYNIGEINGQNSVGGIVGTQGWLSSTEINNCYNKGVVKSITGSVGGISFIPANTTGSTVKNCYNTGNVSATEPTNDYIRSNCRNWKFK